MIKVNLKKLNSAYSRFVSEQDNLCSILQEYTECDIFVLYQESDGFCVGTDRIETNGVTMNISIHDFIRIAKKGYKLTESDLDSIAI